MLIEGFYKITDLNSGDSDIVSTIKLNPNHEVYNGHFPGQPVVPGVIQLQIIKEILQEILGTKLIMKKVIQVKYLTPVIPDDYSILNIKLSIRNTEEKSIRIDATIVNKETVVTKAKLYFIHN